MRRIFSMRPTSMLVTSLAVTLVLALAPATRGQVTVTDETITHAVEHRLLLDESVPFHSVDASTENGIVTLAGTVSDVLARERAADLAMATRGVQAVINTIETAPSRRDDTAIARDVRAALRADPVSELYELDVTVDRGVVTMRGTTDSWSEKQIVLDVAKGVRGVAGVDDRIEVELGSRRDLPIALADVVGEPEPRTDTELAEEIRARLAQDVRLDAGLVDVAVDDGRVTLTGIVGSVAERERAYINAWIRGVEDVHADDIRVDWNARDEMRRGRVHLDDAAIAAAVERTLAHDPRVQWFAPDVQVTDGVVTLSGQVPTLQARRAAESDARYTVGVRNVRNHLKVRPDPRPDDPELADQVRAALARDPYVTRHPIDVMVVDGTVYLTGAVGTSFDERQAEAAAGRVQGVVDVKTDLRRRSVSGRTDRQIADDIRTGLAWNPRVEAEQIDVTVDGGIATLVGSVTSWHERSLAADEALRGGATGVRNRLTVETGNDNDDADTHE